MAARHRTHDADWPPPGLSAAAALGVEGVVVTAMRTATATAPLTFVGAALGCRQAQQQGHLCHPTCRRLRPQPEEYFWLERQRDQKTRLALVLWRIHCADGVRQARPPGFVTSPSKMTVAAAAAGLRRVVAHTLSATSRDTGLSRTALTTLAQRLVARFDQRYQPLAAPVTAADGVGIGRGAAVTMVADAVALRMLDVIPGYSADGFTTWLARCPNRDVVQAIIIDRAKELRAGARAVYPAGVAAGRRAVALVADLAHLRDDVAACLQRLRGFRAVARDMGRKPARRAGKAAS